MKVWNWLMSWFDLNLYARMVMQAEYIKKVEGELKFTKLALEHAKARVIEREVLAGQGVVTVYVPRIVDLGGMIRIEYDDVEKSIVNAAFLSADAAYDEVNKLDRKNVYVERCNAVIHDGRAFHLSGINFHVSIPADEIAKAVDESSLPSPPAEDEPL